MNKPYKEFKPNATTELFDKMNKILYLIRLKDLWLRDVALPDNFIKVYNKIGFITHAINVYFIVSLCGSFFTQHNLTEAQYADRSMLCFIFPGYMTFYFFIFYHKAVVKDLLYHIAVVLREHYNDPNLEQQMIKKIKMYTITFSTVITLIIALKGLYSLFRVITAGDTFVTMIPVWPEVLDRSAEASVMRIIFFFFWWICSAWLLATILLIMTMMVAICYQFKNLQSYFLSLDHIFVDNSLSQEEKEIKYEKAFKLGIQMHGMTLWCKCQHQRVCREISAIEICMFFYMLMTQLSILLGEHSIASVMRVIPMTIGGLFVLGFFMWVGGDITVEALNLSESIYASGWENCYGQSSVRVRKLVVNAIRQAQEPVVYKALGVIEFSYEAYVSLVKMPYSIISVLR